MGDDILTVLTADEVEQQFGGVAAREYANAPDYSVKDLSAWLRKLPTLTDDEYHGAAMSAIWDSAFWNSRRGNHDDAHCKASAAWYEANRRGVADGHQPDCRAVANRYQRAFNQVVRENGHNGMVSPLSPCTCGET